MSSVVGGLQAERLDDGSPFLLVLGKAARAAGIVAEANGRTGMTTPAALAERSGAVLALPVSAQFILRETPIAASGTAAATGTHRQVYVVDGVATVAADQLHRVVFLSGRSRYSARSLLTRTQGSRFWIIAALPVVHGKRIHPLACKCRALPVTLSDTLIFEQRAKWVRLRGAPMMAGHSLTPNPQSLPPTSVSCRSKATERTFVKPVVSNRPCWPSRSVRDSNLYRQFQQSQRRRL